MKLQPSFYTCYQMLELMLLDSPSSLMEEQSPEANPCHKLSKPAIFSGD